MAIRRTRWPTTSLQPSTATAWQYDEAQGATDVKNWLSKRVALKAVKGQAWAPRWWAVFLIGLALWAAAAGSVYVTGDIIVLPTVFLLGSFLVPVTAVVWYLDHDPSPVLSPSRIVTAFLVAGVLAPFGHGMWSAILGGVIFYAFRAGRVRLSWSVIFAYLGVSVLHAAFDMFGSVPGYVVISIIGLVPLAYLWLRQDRGLPFTRRPQPAPVRA